MPGRRGRASMPGSWGLAAIGKKKRAAVLPPTGLEFFSGKNPDLGAGSNAGQARPGFYARRGRHQAEPSQSPGPCYMCYMCYISQGKPLNIHSPPGLCYISQGKPLNIHSPRVPCYMCYMCYISQGKPLNIHSRRVPCYIYMALYSTYTTDFRAYRIYSSKELGESGGSAAWRVRYSTYSTYSKEPGESGGSAAWRVRYSTYSTYSKEPGESGGSAAWRVRYSTYSTYSKEPGESGGSAAWRVRYSTYSTYSKEPGDCGGSAAWRSRVAHPECQEHVHPTCNPTC